MATNPSNSSSMTFQDYDLENGNFSVNCERVSAANAAAQATAFSALVVATQLLSRGVLLRTVEGVETEMFNPTPTTDKEAQREEKWLVQYNDTVTFRRYGVSIPCADLMLLPAGNKGELDLSVAPATTFVNAFEGFALSPDGNPVNVLAIIHVGRNL